MPAANSGSINAQINPTMLGIALARQRAGMKSISQSEEAAAFNSAAMTAMAGNQGGGQFTALNSPIAPLKASRPGEFHLPEYSNTAGKPATPTGTRPMVPAKPFLGKIAEMLCGIIGGGLRAFGSGVKTVTGSGGVSAMSGILGMMGYAGPYGYDPFGPGQSMDPFSQAMPETNSCYQLLETWLRQCSAQPESFLEISSETTMLAISPEARGKAAIKLSSSSGVTLQQLHDNGTLIEQNFPLMESQELFHKFVALEPLINVDAMANDDFLVQMHAISLLEQISNVMGMDVSKYTPPQLHQQQYRGPQQQQPSFSHDTFLGLRGGAGRPLVPNFPSAPAGPITPSRPGMFDQVATGAGMTPAMGGLVSQTLGPDSYNPWVADGAEPDEFQVSGPEKCTRLMNNWLWKCAMSPM
jgi:hypothetical protein